MLKLSPLKIILPVAMLALFITGAKASPVESFDCGVATVMSIPEEGHAQIDTARGTFFADAQTGGHYANPVQELQFYPDDNPPTLWMGSEQINCTVMLADNEVTQTHSNGAVGGNETSVNAQGQSLGGNLRDGPGTNFSKVGAIAEGTWITIITNTGIRFDGYDWFEVALDNGRRGYHWGGIMCSNGAPLAGTYSVCGQENRVNTSQQSSGSSTGWMAFAVGSDNIFGHGAGNSRSEAEQFALQYCNDGSCQVADVTDAQCHALAQAPGGSWFGAAPTQRAAEDFAAGFCVRAGAASCRIAYSYCQ